MSEWSLPVLLAGLHDEIERRLDTARRAFGHPGTKGDASEKVWLELFQTYLPKRYQAATAHVVDSKGTFSDQIDVVVFRSPVLTIHISVSGRLWILGKEAPPYVASPALPVTKDNLLNSWQTVYHAPPTAKIAKSMN